jgi:hypothetical protein
MEILRRKEGKELDKTEVNLSHQSIGVTSAARPTNISKTKVGKCNFRPNDNLTGHRNRPNTRKILPVYFSGVCGGYIIIIFITIIIYFSRPLI